VLVNLSSWNRLTKDLQDLLTNTAIGMEEEYHAGMVGTLKSEEEELQKRGMELLVLPPMEAKKYHDAFYEHSWEELILKKDPEFGPRLKEAVGRMIKK